jgi:hypothetical protein
MPHHTIAFQEQRWIDWQEESAKNPDHDKKGLIVAGGARERKDQASRNAPNEQGAVIKPSYQIWTSRAFVIYQIDL